MILRLFIVCLSSYAFQARERAFQSTARYHTYRYHSKQRESLLQQKASATSLQQKASLQKILKTPGDNQLRFAVCSPECLRRPSFSSPGAGFAAGICLSSGRLRQARALAVNRVKQSVNCLPAVIYSSRFVLIISGVY